MMQVQRYTKILPYIGLLIILSTVILIYLPIGGYDWILGLDQLLLIDNLAVHDLTANKLLDLFLAAENGRYEPLAQLSYAIDLQLFPGRELQAIHLGNLFLHLFNVILFFRIVQILSKAPLAAFIAAALFALHPLNAEAVTWLSARSQLLASFFLQLAILSYIYYKPGGDARNRYKNVSMVFFLLSFLSHPLALAFPLVVLLLDQHHHLSFRNAVSRNAGLIIVAIVGMIFTILVQYSSGYPGMYNSPDFLTRTFFFFYNLALLMISFMVPVGLSPYHPFPAGIEVVSIVMVAIVLAVIVGLIWRMNRQRIVFAGTMVFMISFFFSNFSMPGEQMYYNSQAYFSLLGLFFLAGLFLNMLIERAGPKRLGGISLIILFVTTLFILTYLSNDHKKLWKDNKQLWTSVIEAYPGDGHAFFMRGDHWARNGDFEKARLDYSQCLTRDPNAYMAHNNLGLIFMQEGDLQLANREFRRSIDIYDGFYKPFLNRGISLMRQGNLSSSMEDMNRAAELAPNQALIYYNRGLLYERLNLIPEAIEDFSRAIKLNPYMLIFYKDRGKAFVWMKDYNGAELDFTKALELDPENAEMWFRRSLARSSKNDFKGGLEDAAMAKSLGFPVEEDYIKGLTMQVLKDDLPEEP